MKPNDLYFICDKENYEFWFVTRDFWHENECIDDRCIISSIEDILPKHFLNSSESACNYHRKGLTEDEAFVEGRQLLLDYGFTEIDNPW